ncbi:MAG: T9SS type A sorting domain-containing protein [Flavobacteriaceae bacterium]|nr:T9SS type A sorting domain-containing protein [Flavobacteriaceae bacterium]
MFKPSSTTLFISDLPNGNHSISITDLAGKQILTTKSKNETAITLEIEQLASGIYFIETAGQHLKFVKKYCFQKVK